MLYTDTELDSDIKYVKEMIFLYKGKYRHIENKFNLLNKKITGRVEIILSLFKNIYNSSAFSI